MDRCWKAEGEGFVVQDCDSFFVEEFACEENNRVEILGLFSADTRAVFSSRNPDVGMWIVLCRGGWQEVFEDDEANFSWNMP